MSVFSRKLRSALLAGTALTLAAIAAPHSANAATAIYDGAGATTSTGNYNLGTNYDTGVAPSSTADTAVFNDTAAQAKTTTITFATATNPLGTLSFTGTTAYTFNLTAGQTFNPTVLSNASTANNTFTLTGAGAGMTIGSLNNTTTGGEIFTAGVGSAGFSIGTVAIANDTLAFNGVGSTITGSYTSTGGTLNIAGVTSGTSTVANIAGDGASTITLGANTLTANGAGNTTFAGVVAGAGNVTYAGTGILSLTGANTYTGVTTINAGGTINGTTASLTSSSNVVDNGTLQFTNTGTGTYAKVISGTGAVQILGGTVTLSGANTFTGPLTVTLSTLAGAVTATDLGSSINLNLGTIQAGGTLVTANAVALSGAGTIDSNGNAVTLSGAVTGTGELLKQGAGNLTLSNAANTYSGGTGITAGTVTIGANNAAGSGFLAINTGTTFIMNGFNQSVAGISGAGNVTSTGGALTSTAGGTFTGNITSTGTLTQSTGGLQILDGTNSFSTTNVTGGSLEIGDATHTGATLASGVTVQNGGTLLGHGTIIGNLTSNGTVAPGGSIGTLTVSGNYQATPASTLAIELNPTTSSQLAVGGSAGLAGTLAFQPDPGVYTTGTQYTILTANGGVSGRFANTTDTSNSVIFATTYLPNSVVVTAVNLNQAFVSQTPNEARVAGAVRSIVPTASATPGFLSGLAGIFGTMQLGGNRAQVADALGELRADTATITLANSTAFQNILVDRMSQRQGLTTSHMANNGLPGTFDVAMNDSDLPLFGPSPTGGKEQPTVWMHGYGVLSEVGGESGFSDYQSRTGGIVAGIDSMITQRILIGAAVAYDHTDYNLNGTSDENNIDTYRVSVYGSSKLDPIPLVVDASVGYALNDYHNNSFLPLITASGFSQTSRHEGNTFTAEGGLSHAFSVPQNFTSGKVTLIPRAGIEYDNIQQNDFSTTGAPVRALDFHTEGSSLNALRSTIGGKADVDFKTDNGTIVTPEVRASYLHDFMDTNVTLTENFTGAGAAGFNIQGVRPGRDAALVGTGVNVAFKDNVSANISYDANVRDHELDNVIQAGVKYTW